MKPLAFGAPRILRIKEAVKPKGPPLLAVSNLPKMAPETREILTNCHVIAIDQDEPGLEANRTCSDGETAVWRRQLAGALAVAVLNTWNTRYSTHQFHLRLSPLRLHSPQKTERTLSFALEWTLIV